MVIFFAISWDFDFVGMESRQILQKSNFVTKIIEKIIDKPNLLIGKMR